MTEPDLPVLHRREYGDVVLVVGTDAAAVGRAVHDESGDPARRVLAFVGSPDHPALAEMLAELARDDEGTATPRS